MQFGTSQRRSLWTRAAAGTAFDVIVALVIATIMGSHDLFGTAMIFLAIQAIYFFMWVKRTTVLWGWFVLGGRKRLGQHMADFLREVGFPRPANYYLSPSDYLEETAANEGLKASVRIAAASELSSLNTIRQIGLIQLGIQSNLAWEDAIKIFRRSFPVGSDGDE
jgi:hypothetical protein